MNKTVRSIHHLIAFADFGDAAAAAGFDAADFDLLTSLPSRPINKSYRARLVRRKYIPKGDEKLRPLGIPTLEDKLMQHAVAQILSAIFEADFLPCSYGYRPGRSLR